MFMLEDEVYINSVIPSLRTEMWRKIDIAGDVVIKGGIFGRCLDVNPRNVWVQKAVYVKDYIAVSSNDKASRVSFASVVASDNSIEVSGTTRARFVTDISSKRLNLNNTIIYGNVYAAEVIAENSVILGEIFAKEKLEVGNSIIGSFKTKNFVQRSSIGILHPFAVSEKPPVLSGKMFNLLSWQPDDQDNSHHYELFPSDIHLESIVNNDQRLHVQVLSSCHRVFDLKTYLQMAANNLKKIELSTFFDNDDYEKAEQRLNEFDEQMFSLVYNRFDLKPRIEYSDFMDLESSVLQNIKHIESPDVARKFVVSPSYKETAGNSSTVDQHVEISEEVIVEAVSEDDEEDQVLEAVAEDDGIDDVIEAEVQDDDDEVLEASVIDDESETKMCINCGTENKSNVYYCTKCGRQL